MSASTASITPNQGPTTRRRAFRINDSTSGSDASASSRDEREPWFSMVGILNRNIALLVVLMGFTQMIPWVLIYSGRDTRIVSPIPRDFDARLADMETFVKTTLEAIQAQANAIDWKVEGEISSVRKELNAKIEELTEEMDTKLKALDHRSAVLESFIEVVRSKMVLTKEEFVAFFNEYQSGNGREEISMDAINDQVKKTVEKEIEKHAADGIGMADYAAASGGGKVLRHSDPYGVRIVGQSQNRNVVSSNAEKMIEPSFGEVGHCFPLEGKTGFVEIQLRTAIVPEAITLEHVAKNVAFDRSSAPKDCRVLGLLQRPYSMDIAKNNRKEMFVLAEFTYDLEKSSAQTFKVNSRSPNLVNVVRFEFSSNHGSMHYTCIYRLRVHGHEPTAVRKDMAIFSNYFLVYCRNFSMDPFCKNLPTL